MVSISGNLLAIVTGASAGIGKACAITLAQQGFDVLMVARNKDKLQQSQSEVQALTNTNVFALSADLYNPDSADLIVEWLSQYNGTLQVLVNNAGGVETSAPFSELTDEDWHRTFEVNVFSVVRLCRVLLPRINKDGRIINISSITANEPGHYNPHYSAAKAAQNNFTKHFAQIAANQGVTVNSVSPGIIETEGWREHMRHSLGDDDLQQKLANARQQAGTNIPLKRLGTAEDVAGLVSYLTSPGAAYITGSDFTIDGGKRRQI